MTLYGDAAIGLKKLIGCHSKSAMIEHGLTQEQAAELGGEIYPMLHPLDDEMSNSEWRANRNKCPECRSILDEMDKKRRKKK